MIKLRYKFNVFFISISKVGIKESPELDIATLSFTYNIQDPGDYDHDKLCKDTEFNNYIGAVLEHIINETMGDKLDEDIIGHNEPNTDTYAEPSS